jgi:uncharacterized iron-regulated membrane protein
MLKSVLYQAHLWLGLLTGVIMLVLGVTGSILAIEPDLRATPPTSGSPARLPLADIVRRAEREHPGYRVRQLRPAPPGGAQRLLLGSTRPGPGEPLLLAVDPASGKVLARRRPGAGWLGGIHRLHGNLLAGSTGRSVNGAFGIALLLLAITGFVLWLPRKQWKLTPATGWRRRNWNLHHAAGIFTLWFLALEGLTGAVLAFPNATRALLGLPRQQQPLRGLRPVAVTTAPLDRFLENARAVWPEFRITTLTLPARPGDPVVVAGRLPGDARWREDASRLRFDAASARLLGSIRARDLSAAANTLDVLRALHTGRIGGRAARVLYFALGLAPGVLFSTGLIMWLNRLAAQRRALRPSARAAEAHSSRGEHVTHVS